MGIGGGLRCVMVPGVGSMGGKIGLIGSIGSIGSGVGTMGTIGSIGSDVGFTVGFTDCPLLLAVANAFVILDVTPFVVVVAASVAREGAFESETATFILFLGMIVDNFFVYSFFFKSSFFFQFPSSLVLGVSDWIEKDTEHFGASAAAPCFLPKPRLAHLKGATFLPSPKSPSSKM